jgi:hypothetical protein
MILLFEEYSPNMDLNNDIKNHLSQFPYLSYTIKDDGAAVIYTFNKDVSLKYAKGVLDPFKIEILGSDPVKIRIVSKKPVDSYEEFKGKVLIGSTEKIDIPTLKLKDIDVKVDSGASCSSLHCSWIHVDRNKKKVSFIPLDKSYKQFNNTKFVFPLMEEVNVQNSGGEQESRPLIKLDIIIKGKTYETFFSLTNREELEYPILIGRDIISGNFLIDVGIK